MDVSERFGNSLVTPGGVFTFLCVLHVYYGLINNAVYFLMIQQKHHKVTTTTNNKQTYCSLFVVPETNFLVEMIFVLIQPNLSNSVVVLAWVGTANEAVYCTMSKQMANMRARQNFNRPATHPNLHVRHQHKYSTHTYTTDTISWTVNSITP